ncbi:MAG: hypothetical protein V1915_05020 [Candidatus Bathyarchaeota archaeon]
MLEASNTKENVWKKVMSKKMIGVLLFALSGYIGADLLYYALWHYTFPEFSLGGAVFGVCLALGYLYLKSDTSDKT